MKYFIVIILNILFISCTKNKNESEDKKDYRKNSELHAYFSFPDTVKIRERNLAIVKFYNPTFDSIVEPRIKDSLKYRYIIFSEFEPVNFLSEHFESKNIDTKKFKDSVYLDDREIYIAYEFNEVGVYEIGGLVRDQLIYDYRFIKPDSMQFYTSFGLISRRVVVIN